jgi:2'-5' RNA ligase
MYGVVALLDGQNHQRVQDLWVEFKQEVGIQGYSRAPVPHFSFHVAERYNLEKVAEVLEKVCAHTAPFTVRTNGLGIFTGELPVLYIPVIRSPLLTNLHQHLWEPLSAAATGVANYYNPDEWRAHITLAYGDMNHDQMVQVIRAISDRSFSWQVKVDTLALLSSLEEPENTIVLRIPLEGPAAEA